MRRKHLIIIIALTIVLTLWVAYFTGIAIRLVKNNDIPNNSMIHKELVIRDAGKYSSLYVDEIVKDRGTQQIGLSVDKKGNDLHIYILAQKTSKYQTNDFSNWLINYYGAEEIKMKKAEELK